MFPYKRWKLTRGELEALDSDETSIEQVELHIFMQNKEGQIIAVNEDWSLANLRKYLALCFGLKGDFSFVINGISIRKRKERSILCKENTSPQYIHVE